MVVDSVLCVLTVWFSYYLRLDQFVALDGPSLIAITSSLGIALPIFVVSGLYRAVFRYSGLPALLTVARAIGIYGIIYFSIFTAIGVAGVPRTVGIIQPILLLLFVGASRAFTRLWRGGKYHNIVKRAARPRVLIYGAGRTGRQLVAATTNCHEMQVVGFLDDDSRLHGQLLNGKFVYNPADLSDLASTLGIRVVLLAMPRQSRKQRNKILARIRGARVAVRTLPSVTDLAQGRFSVSDLNELEIDDLLGREPVVPNHVLLSAKVAGKIVMVTGAGGSIGSELCRQILTIGPRKMLLIEQNEFALYEIHQELEAKLEGRDIVLVPLLASVRDIERMREILSIWYPDTLYHPAAYKHVPLVEQNPAEGIKNNVLGTLCTA